MPANESIFDSAHRTLTVGILLGVTLVAFETLAVVTIAPRFAAELGGTNLYGWVFSAMLLTSLLGAAAGGQLADRSGPGRVIVAGLLFFGLGLLVAGFAPTMEVLLLGRLFQGLGGGALVTALYAVVNLAYSDPLRPSLFAAMSGAWIVPGLLGPMLAALVAAQFGWRFVFWGLLPLLLVVAWLTVPAFGSSPRGAPTSVKNRLPQALMLSAGAGFLLAGLSLFSVWGLLLIVLGLPLIVLGLRALLPAGTLTSRVGLPSVIASRALFYASFAGVEAFLSFMLVRVHGYSETMTGTVIATGSLSWALGSFLQSRFDQGGAALDLRAQRVRGGTLLLAVGLSVQLVALLLPRLALPASVVGWSLAGLGIGLAHSTSSVLAFSLAPEGEGGAVSAGLQIADQFSAALATGVGGALLALSAQLGRSETLGVGWAFGFCLVLILGAVALSGRIAVPPQRAKRPVSELN